MHQANPLESLPSYTTLQEPQLLLLNQKQLNSGPLTVTLSLTFWSQLCRKRGKNMMISWRKLISWRILISKKGQNCVMLSKSTGSMMVIISFVKVIKKLIFSIWLWKVMPSPQKLLNQVNQQKLWRNIRQEDISVREPFWKMSQELPVSLLRVMKPNWSHLIVPHLKDYWDQLRTY